jgi:hypothetical protein
MHKQHKQYTDTRAHKYINSRGTVAPFFVSAARLAPGSATKYYQRSRVRGREHCCTLLHVSSSGVSRPRARSRRAVGLQCLHIYIIGPSIGAVFTPQQARRVS